MMRPASTVFPSPTSSAMSTRLGVRALQDVPDQGRLVGERLYR